MRRPPDTALIGGVIGGRTDEPGPYSETLRRDWLGGGPRAAVGRSSAPLELVARALIAVVTGFIASRR